MPGRLTQTIPTTRDELVSELNANSQVIDERQWKQAAFVYAWTYEGVNQYDGVSDVTQLTIREFSRLGILNLSSHNTIRKYRKRYQWAIDNGYALPTIPGEPYELPNIPFDPPEPIDRTQLDECINDIGYCRPKMYSIRNRFDAISESDQRMELRDHLQSVADEFAMMAMEIGDR